jgi:hypothetical protein
VSDSDPPGADDASGARAGASASDPRISRPLLSANFGLRTLDDATMILPRSVFTGDLQDPPEVTPELFKRWKAGVQVVWAARQRREGERATTVGFSRLYYWVMRNVVGMKEMAATGADFFLLDRAVVDAFSSFNESIAGFLYAGLVVVNFMRGNPIEGWSSLIIVVLLIGGVQMVMMGVLGEYLWRALDESRRRPRYLIEATTGDGSLRPSPF